MNFNIDDVLTFYAATVAPSTGAAADIDSSGAPSYRIYEEETATPILTGNMALLDSSNTDGLYSEQVTLSAANGFENGKCYCVRVAGTVGGVAGHDILRFRVGVPAVNTSHWGGTAVASANVLIDGAITAAKIASDAITAAKIADGALTAAKFAAGAFAAVWTTLTSSLTTVGSIGKLIVDNLNDTITSRMETFTYTAPDNAGISTISTNVSTLLTRLSSARAGYLDNLNVGGAVASQADINALNQSASRRAILTVLAQWERPESGAFTKTIELRTYDGDGAPTNADSNPTLTVTGATSGDLSTNLGVIANPSTGVYRWVYTGSSADTLEDVRIDAVPALGGTTYPLAAFAQVVDIVSALWTTSDATKLTAIYNKLPSKTYLTGTANADGDVQMDEATGDFPGKVAGIAGTIQTLDALDTAQDSQHAATQALIAALNNLSIANVRTAVGLASANLDSQLSSILSAIGAISAGSDASLLQSTTIATLASQTSFTLTAGSADNDAYNNAILVVIDQVTSTQKAFKSISDYVGATKTVTLSAAPEFTIAVGDSVYIIAVGSTSSGGGDATLAKQNQILAAIEGSEVIQVASPNVSGNLVLTQGDTYDGVGNPLAQWTVTTDYTDGWTVAFTIRNEADAVVYTTSGTVASSTLITVAIDAPTGLTMTGCPGQWQGKFDVQLTKSGSVKTIALGTVYINEDQTR